MVVTQGSKEQTAEAKPIPFSGHLLPHGTQHLYSLAHHNAKGLKDGATASHTSHQVLFKNKFRQKQEKPSFILHIHLAHLQQEDVRCFRIEASLS